MKDYFKFVVSEDLNDSDIVFTAIKINDDTYAVLWDRFDEIYMLPFSVVDYCVNDVRSYIDNGDWVIVG